MAQKGKDVARQVRILRMLREIERKQIQIGVFENSHYESEDGAAPVPVAYVAAIQEFGDPETGIPARPFLRPTMEKRRSENMQALARGLRAAMKGDIGVDAVLEQVGKANAGAVMQAISKIYKPPLAESTIEARRRKRESPGVSTKPLVDTGLLRESITSKVVDV